MRARSVRTASGITALALLLAVGCSDNSQGDESPDTTASPGTAETSAEPATEPDSGGSGGGGGGAVGALDESGTRIELGPTELTVMSFNVWIGGKVVDIGQVAAAIEASGADVVGLQEADGNVHRIAELVGWAHADEQHQVISRYPLIAPPGETGYVYVQLAPGQVVAIADIHLTSDPYGPYLVRDGATLDEVIANEHDTRMWEVDELAVGWQSAFDDGVPLFVTGDFNAPSHRDWTEEAVGERHQILYPVEWPISMAMEELGFVDTFRDAHPDPVATPGITWTFGYPFPRLLDDEAQDRIDFVWVAGAEEIVSSELVGPAGAGDVTIPIDPYPSDHLGVVSTVIVDPVEPPLFVSADLRVGAGDPVGIRYHAPGGYETDRVVLVPADGDAPEDGLAMVDTAEAGYHGRVVLGTAGLAAGEYEAVLLTVDDAGEPVEVSRDRFWLVDRGARPTVETTEATIAAGDPVEVTWHDAFARKWDWIGLFSADDPDVYGYFGFAYTGATVTGSYTFGPDDLGEEMLPPGDYVARLMSDDSYASLAEVSFTVE